MPLPAAPSRTQRTCAWILRRCGWTVEFRWPPVSKCVVIFYPHTSNWDFVWGVLAYLSLGWPIRRCGKDTWFRWPLGILGRALGGREEEDLARFRAYYSDKRGVHPELQGDIRFNHSGARAPDRT